MSDLAVRWNTIRLTLNALSLLVVCLIGFLMRRRRGGEGRTEGSPVIGPE